MLPVAEVVLNVQTCLVTEKSADVKRQLAYFSIEIVGTCVQLVL